MNWARKLGPGLLYAGAAVGVSHIVQSTKAGAIYGWAMVLVVVLANVLKYPFFEFGPRYANSTGQNLLHGYKRLGNWALVLFLLATVLTMFIIQAAVTIVTAGLAINLFDLNIEGTDLWALSAGILGTCVIVLSVGRYSLLDRLMKVIMVVLSITTVAALFMSLGADIPKPAKTPSFDFSEEAMFFLIAFMGWMPAPLDISVWHSVWSVSKQKETGTQPDLKSGLFDFKVGFWGTMVLAIFFVGLGTMMLHGTGIPLEKKAGPFAQQLIGVYTNALGDWSYYIIAIAAFTTMLSTTITCLDAFGRVLHPTVTLLRSDRAKDTDLPKINQVAWLTITSIGAVIILKYFVTDMDALITFVTTASFLAAPVIAVLNYKVIFGLLPLDQQPGQRMKQLSWVGIAFMSALSLYYLSTFKDLL